MLNVSRMPTIRPGFTRIDVCRTRPRNPFYNKDKKLGKLVEIRKVGSNHEGLSSTKIYSKESFTDLKRRNLRFEGSRGKIVLFMYNGCIIINLNMQLIILLVKWMGYLGRENRN